MKYTALIQCYGNTRSNMLTAAVRTHLENMKIDDIAVETGGLPSFVEGIYKRSGTTDVPLPKGVVDLGFEVDQTYGQKLSQARRLVATPARLSSSQVVLVVDANLAQEDAKLVTGLPLETVLKYAGHQAPVWGCDLDDASPRGALAVVQAKAQGKTEPEIQAAVANGELLYHAPLGGSYKIGSHEAEKTEVGQLFNLAKILAVEMVKRSR